MSFVFHGAIPKCKLTWWKAFVSSLCTVVLFHWKEWRCDYLAGHLRAYNTINGIMLKMPKMSRQHHVLWTCVSDINQGDDARHRNYIVPSLGFFVVFSSSLKPREQQLFELRGRKELGALKAQSTMTVTSGHLSWERKTILWLTVLKCQYRQLN